MLSGVTAPGLVAPPIVAPVIQGLTVTLTTNQKVYHEGQPIVMTLTETNSSNHDVTVTFGPSTDGFYITKHGQKVWASNTGPQPQFVEVRMLRPGESITLSATWNGQSNTGSVSTPTGVLVVHSQIAGAPAVAIRMERA